MLPAAPVQAVALSSLLLLLGGSLRLCGLPPLFNLRLRVAGRFCVGSSLCFGLVLLLFGLLLLLGIPDAN